MLMMVTAVRGALAQEAARGHEDPGKVYDPMARDDDMGRLHLSETRARFDLLKGQMVLQFAGKTGRLVLDEAVVLPSVRMYRVVNWSDYFAKNYHRNRFCGRPILWLGIAIAPPGEGRVLFYDRNYGRAFDPNAYYGLCVAAPYAVEGLEASPQERLRRVFSNGDYGPVIGH